MYEFKDRSKILKLISYLKFSLQIISIEYISKNEFKEMDIEQWKKLGNDKAIDMDFKGIIKRDIHL